MAITKEQALEYHEGKQPGKTSVITTKPCHTADDLSMAYTPGVAEPVREIFQNSENCYKYTNKGNLVAVISNGTAILGLGDLGPLASKPVMEGKGVLFKRFADVDTFDLEIDEKDPEKIVAIVKSLAPTFGGINLEDIKAPECFYIEETLKKEMDIPVFHDDQHGTAIIVGAGLLNALEIVGKDAAAIKVVFSGAGAAGNSCARFILSMGVKKENVFMFDKSGPLHAEREDLSVEQRYFAHNHYQSLSEAMKGADLFIGVSASNILSVEMVKSMAEKPIIFAMANPDPEISYELAVATRKDVIMATGRSDYPNQINNVLGFPFIFRGALDVGATHITEGMKIAAARALAALAKEPVPEVVRKAYGNKSFSFGAEYIVPKPFDPRVIEWESVAVAKEAVREGIARKPISDWEGYREELKARMKKYWD